MPGDGIDQTFLQLRILLLHSGESFHLPLQFFNTPEFFFHLRRAGELVRGSADERDEDVLDGGELAVRIIFGLDAGYGTEWYAALIGQVLVRPSKELLPLVASVDQFYKGQEHQIRHAILSHPGAFNTLIKHDFHL